MAYLLGVYAVEEDILGKVNYCLTILKPKYYPADEYMRIYCILHFNLEGSKQHVQEQTPEDYVSHENSLKFQTGRYESYLEIQVDKKEAEACGWLVTLESEMRIYVEDVNIYNYRSPRTLHAACITSDIHKPYPYTWPPRFVLQVSARNATCHSTINLTFKGATRYVYVTVPLRLEESDVRLTTTSSNLGEKASTRSILDYRPHISYLHNETLKCDCNGLNYTINGHDITVDIPQGAVPEGKNIEIEVGVAVNGPFGFPENAMPISPFFWIRLLDGNVKSELQKAFKIVLPHCFARDKLLHHQISFVKAEYETVHEERAKQLYMFTQCQVSTNFWIEEMCGILQTNSGGIFSITMAPIESSDIAYCLAQVDLPPSPPTHEFHFYGILNLASHRRALEQYLQGRRKQVTRYTSFMFLPHTEQLQLVSESELEHVLEPMNGEIKVLDIHSWGITDQDEEQIRNFPPQIKIRMNNITSHHSYPIKFIGCVDLLEFNLDLLSDAGLFEEAMQNGYVVLQSTVLLLIGVAGAGKTCFCHLILSEPPPPVRKSTPLANSSIRALSLTKAIVSGQEDVIWKRVSQHQFRGLIADAIKSLHDSKSSNLPSPSNLRAQQSVSKIRKAWLLLGQLLSGKFFREIEMGGQGSQPQLYEKDLSNTTIKMHGQKRKNKKDRAIAAVEIENSAPASTKLDHLFELKPVKQILALISSSKGSVELFRQKWLYIIDTGGQPQFHELLPTFVHHVSAAAFFVKLNEELEGHPEIEYYDKEGAPCGEPYKSPSTHLQTLQNCLQAMQSRHELNNLLIDKCPELYFVGTHLDLENRQESSISKNKKIISMLREHKIFKDHLNYYSVGKPEQLLYCVNAEIPESKDENIAAKFRQSIMEKCQAQHDKIPIRWFILELLLQHLAQNGVISFKECLEVAHRLGMNEARLRAAIDYLIKLNIFEYFHEILPNVVFTTSQVLLNKITELVEYSHELNSNTVITGDSADIKFHEYGIISEDMLQRDKFSSHYVKGLFEVKDLLSLWKELLIITKGTLVMPAVLSELPHEKLSKYRLKPSSRMVPIAVHYTGGLFPSGIFSSLISHLRNKCNWMISMEAGEPECLYKNCVLFNVKKEVNANVTLIYFHNWIELHIINMFDEDEQKACCLLRNSVFSGLKHVQKVQKYDGIIPEMAFFCSCENKQYDHLASANEFQCEKYTSKRGTLTEKHQLWLHSLEARLTELFLTDESTNEKGTEESVIIKKRRWYQRAHKSSSAQYSRSKKASSSNPFTSISKEQTPLNEHNHSVLLKQLQTHSAKWREIGSSLGFCPSELNEIQARPPLWSGGPRSFLNAMLADWLQWAPGDSRGSTNFALLEDLKVALHESGLTQTARDLGI